MNISASMIAYHSAPTIVTSLESIYPYVSQISIAYGPLADWPFRLDDGTRELLLNFPDPDRKISLVIAREWPGRREMRESTAERLTGDYHLMVDSDEVWSDFPAWVDWAEREKPVSAYAAWITPFRGCRHWVYSTVGGKCPGWGGPRLPKGVGSWRPRYQFSRWGPGYKWHTHWAASSDTGRNLYKCAKLKWNIPTRMWHFGWALPARYIHEKVKYYQSYCPGLIPSHRAKERQKEEVWFGWKGKEGLFDTFNPGDTVAAALAPEQVPPIAQKCMDRIRQYYDGDDEAFQERLDAPRD